MKKLKQDARQLMGRYETMTRDDFVKLLDKVIEDLPENQRASATFEIDEYGYAYDDSTYYALYLKWNRPETDKEETDREAQEAMHAKLRADRDRIEFERLKKQFGE